MIFLQCNVSHLSYTCVNNMENKRNASYLWPFQYNWNVDLFYKKASWKIPSLPVINLRTKCIKWGCIMETAYRSVCCISGTTERVPINSGVDAQNKVWKPNFILFWIGHIPQSLTHIQLKSNFCNKLSLKKTSSYWKFLQYYTIQI